LQLTGKHVLMATMLGAAVVPPAALASTSKHKTPPPKPSVDQVTMSVPKSAPKGQIVKFVVSSRFSDAGNGAEDMTIFLAPPSAPACPKTPRPPHGADVVLSNEPADRVLVVDAQSDHLEQSGHWGVCSYLVKGRKITAKASASLQVS
jgi:hypothetical protein